MPKRKAESNSMTDVQMHNANGSTAYGKAAVNGLLKEESKPTAPKQTSQDDLQLVLQSFRLLIADLCQQFGMGSYYHVSDNRSGAYDLRTSWWSNRHGCVRRRALEVHDEVRAAYARLVQ